MTTASTATPMNFTTAVGYTAMAAELYSIIFSTLGITQTADTGQLSATPTLTLPTATNQVSGFWIGRFNDSLQATAPIFFKLEIGSGASITEFQIILTVGTGSNGTGTITGTGAGVLTRVECCANTAALSTTTNYITRACYSAADGIFWIKYKEGSTSAPNSSMGGFAIFRDVNSAGAPQGNAVMFLTNAASATSGISNAPGSLQALSFLNATVYNTGSFPSTNWAATFPLALAATAFGGNIYGGPIWQFTPVPGISNAGQMMLISEVPLGTTISLTIIGSTPHTYIQAGCIHGGSAISSNVSSTYGICCLWE